MALATFKIDGKLKEALERMGYTGEIVLSSKKVSRVSQADKAAIKALLSRLVR